MNISENVKSYLKRYNTARWINARMKSWHTKQTYQNLCKRYQTSSILSNGPAISQVGRQLFQETLIASRRPLPLERPKVLFVGTDWEQDRSGIIQALNQIADVCLFEANPGQPGQLYPKSLNEFESARDYNANRLLQYLKDAEKDHPFQAIIGQMWGFSMHWRALAAARDMGISVVNIAMDDRHAFVGGRLTDGTLGGTLGLTPYLTLACTDAPECVHWYEVEGVKSIYLPEASDPELFHPDIGPKQYDVCFVGANYGIRARMVEELKKAGISVQVYGKGWAKSQIPTEQVPGLFSRSKIVLGCGTIGYCDDFLALKLRDFDAPMSGSLYLTHDNFDLHPLFEIGQEIMTFSNISELISKVQFALCHDAERQTIANAGRQRAMKDHTWVQRFKTILSLI